MLKSKTLRATTLCALLAIAPVATGCFGGFRLTQKLWGFNNTVSHDKFIKWLVFLAFVIVPIYQVSTLVDALVLNSIEFWSGKNPVGQGEVREDTRIVQGRTVHTRMTADALRIEIDEAGHAPRIVEVALSAEGAVARDGSGALLAQVSAGEDGSVRVTDAAGRELLSRDGTQVAELASAVLAGSPFTAVLDSQQRGMRVARR